MGPHLYRRCHIHHYPPYIAQVPFMLSRFFPDISAVVTFVHLKVIDINIIYSQKKHKIDLSLTLSLPAGHATLVDLI